MDISDWQDKKELSLTEMDSLIKEYVKKREDYDAAKKVASTKYEELSTLEERIITTLEGAGKKSYRVDGLGTFSVATKLTITTPKTVDQKSELFEYIREKHGEEVLLSMLSINYQTLNSFYNTEASNAEDRAMFSLPGVEAPMSKKEPRFTRSK